MSVQSEAERAAEKIAGLVPRRIDDPLLNIPTDLFNSLSSGEQALVRMARSVEALGSELPRVDERCREEVGLALATFGMYVATGAETTG